MAANKGEPLCRLAPFATAVIVNDLSVVRYQQKLPLMPGFSFLGAFRLCFAPLREQSRVIMNFVPALAWKGKLIKAELASRNKDST
jgi:hypothetical protein